MRTDASSTPGEASGSCEQSSSASLDVGGRLMCMGEVSVATLNIGPQPTLCVTVGLRIIIHCLRNVDFLGQTLIQPMRDISSGVVDWVKRAILLILRRALQAASGPPQLSF